MKFVDATMALGQNAVTPVALVAFGVSAKLTPSLLTSVGTWNGIGYAAIVFGVLLAIGAMLRYASAFKINSSVSIGTRFVNFLSIIFGCFMLYTAMWVAVSWASNNVAMRYCAGKPSAEYLNICKRVYEIP